MAEAQCRRPSGSGAPTSLTHWGAFTAAIDDAGTSSLARGCTGAHVLVQVEKFTGPLPPVRAHEPPVIRVQR
jgi:biotin/methionine sulfoxide reductase